MASGLIQNLANSNDSTVFGLVGPWGSGKSSVLNFIQRKLTKDIAVVKFNPWSFDDERLQAELYSTIVSAFPQGSRQSLRTKSFNLIRRTGPGLKFIPEVGEKLAAIAEELIPDDSWDTAFKDLWDTIKKASVKVLIVVDDVDRLQPQELLLLMKTIRLLGRFPRVNYLLSYDRKSTISTLGQALGDDNAAAVYLEKIVQYPLDLPDPQQHFLQKIVQDALGPIVTAASLGLIGPTPKMRFDAFHAEHMSATLTTPRACRRYVLQAQTFLTLAGEDVDAADFFALTFLRLFHANLYARLPGWIDDLASSDVAYAPQGKRLPKEVWIARLRSLLYTAEQAEDLAEALGSLFPRAFDSPQWTMVGGKHRVYEREYFERYFNFSLPAGDVSDVLVRQDLERIFRGELVNGAKCSGTFDHPVEGVQTKALKKGSRETDHQRDTKHLVDYLAYGLAHFSAIEGFSAPVYLKTQWLGKAMPAVQDWSDGDVQKLVQLFERPEKLGYALQLQQVQSESPLGHLEAEASLPPTPSFVSAVKAAWVGRAVSWLIDQWAHPDPSVPESERFIVWEYLAVFSALPKLQEATSKTLESKQLTLTAVITAFTVCPRILGDTKALPTDLQLVIPKLRETVPMQMLMDLPLEPQTLAEETDEHEMPTAAQRTNFAVEHLLKWRTMKPEATDSK